MSDFNWQTEDEDSWDENDFVRETAVSPHRFRPFLLILLAAALLGGAGFVVYRQATQRVETATANVESDILSTHNVVRYAAGEGDYELLRTVLSGRDAEWAAAQSDLLQEELLFDRAPFGLEMVRKDGELSLADLTAMADDETLEITLAPDFKEAELRFAREYGAAVGHGLTETVTLEQTAVYRLGGERWLLAPPDNTFWQGSETYKGRPLTLIYPKRDEEIAQKLALTLDEKLNETCQYLLDTSCPRELDVYLTFSTDPETLLHAADPAALLDGRLLLELPAPTLVGLPTDGDGFQALARGYGAQITTAVIAYLNGWECCAQAPIHQALIDRQLADLGLRVWPMDVEDYREIAFDAASYDQLSALYMTDAFVAFDGEDNGRLAYLLVEQMLDENPDLTAADLQRDLAATSVGAFISWSDEYLDLETGVQPGFSTAYNFEYLFERYAVQRVIETQAPLSVPFPAQDVQILCDSGDLDFNEMVLYRYGLETAVWAEEARYDGFALMSALPDDNSAVFSLIDFETDKWQTVLRQDGNDRLIANDGYTVSLGQMDPSQRYLVGLNAAASVDESLGVSLIDTKSCDETVCDSWKITGMPIWSPDGAAALTGALDLTMFEPYGEIKEVDLHRGDTALADSVIVGKGYAPFWLDDETYGYLRRLPQGGAEIVITAVADDDPQAALSLAQLLEPLDLPENRLQDFELYYAAVHPAHSDLLFTMAIDWLEEEVYLFTFDRASGAVELLLRGLRVADHSLDFSPDGRYLIITEALAESFRAFDRTPYPMVNLHLYEIESGAMQTFPMLGVNFMSGMAYDWSADGKWLVYQANENALNLIVPDDGEQTMIPREFNRCTSLAWVNGGGE